MRHKYFTAGLVLARTPLSEASASVALVCPDFGVIRARAQGLRKPGAKMGAGLATLAESDVSLVRGKDGWRATGAVLAKDWAHALPGPARLRAGRVAELVLRLAHGESSEHGPALFSILTAYVLALAERAKETDELLDAAELLAVLRVLRAFGLATGDTYGDDTDFSGDALARVAAERKDVLARVNKGIAASGL